MCVLSAKKVLSALTIVWLKSLASVEIKGHSPWLTFQRPLFRPERVSVMVMSTNIFLLNLCSVSAAV